MQSPRDGRPSGDQQQAPGTAEGRQTPQSAQDAAETGTVLPCCGRAAVLDGMLPKSVAVRSGALSAAQQSALAEALNSTAASPMSWRADGSGVSPAADRDSVRGLAATQGRQLQMHAQAAAAASIGHDGPAPPPQPNSVGLILAAMLGLPPPAAPDISPAPLSWQAKQTAAASVAATQRPSLQPSPQPAVSRPVPRAGPAVGGSSGHNAYSGAGARGLRQPFSSGQEVHQGPGGLAFNGRPAGAPQQQALTHGSAAAGAAPQPNWQVPRSFRVCTLVIVLTPQAADCAPQNGVATCMTPSLPHSRKQDLRSCCPSATNSPPCTQLVCLEACTPFAWQADAAKMFARAYWGLPQLQPELAAQALHATLPAFGANPDAALLRPQAHSFQAAVAGQVSSRCFATGRIQYHRNPESTPAGHKFVMYRHMQRIRPEWPNLSLAIDDTACRLRSCRDWFVFSVHPAHVSWSGAADQVPRSFETGRCLQGRSYQPSRIPAGELSLLRPTAFGAPVSTGSDLHAHLAPSTAAAAALRATLSQPALDGGAAGIGLWPRPPDHLASAASQVSVMLLEPLMSHCPSFTFAQVRSRGSHAVVCPVTGMQPGSEEHPCHALFSTRCAKACAVIARQAAGHGVAAWSAQHPAAVPRVGASAPTDAAGVADDRPGLITSAAHWRRHSAPPQAIVLAPPNFVLSQVHLLVSSHHDTASVASPTADLHRNVSLARHCFWWVPRKFRGK